MSEMSWTDSDHARLVQLKVQRADLLRVPDEEKDKEKIRKLTIEIKQIKKRLIALEKGGSVAIDAEPEPELELKSDSVATQLDPSDDEAKSEGEEGEPSPSSPVSYTHLTLPRRS